MVDNNVVQDVSIIHLTNLQPVENIYLLYYATPCNIFVFCSHCSWVIIFSIALKNDFVNSDGTFSYVVLNVHK